MREGREAWSALAAGGPAGRGRGFKWGGNGRDGGTDAATAAPPPPPPPRPLQALLRWFPRLFFSRNPSLTRSVVRSIDRSAVGENENALTPRAVQVSRRDSLCVIESDLRQK